MKKLVFAAIMLLVSVNVYSQDVKREGNTFSQVSNRTISKGTETPTKYTWKDSKGLEYTIYISGTGHSYIKKVSQKTGKEYKQYLPKETQKQIAKELGIKYEEGNKQNN